MKSADRELPFCKNDIIDAEITAASNDGAGVAKIDGFVVFVENGVVGDVCKVRILKCLKHRAYAKIEQIITPSEYRTEPDCEVFYKCGGCRLRHVSYQAELDFKKRKINDLLERIGGVTAKCEKIIGADNVVRYRNKALVPVGEAKDGRIISGFYRKGSHDIVEMPDCLIQNECVSKISGAVSEYMSAENIRAYDEISGKGAVRRIFVRTSSKTGEAIVMLVSADKNLRNTHKLTENILKVCPQVVGIILNINKERGNKAFGQENITLYGRDYIEDELCGLKFRISPVSFFQINPEQAQKLYNQAIKMAEIDENTNVLDLYCGTGTITLCMAKRAKYAVGAEIIPEAVRDAYKNAEQNGINNVRFICADAGEAATVLANEGYIPEVVTVDPPRKGLDSGAIDAIVKINPKRIVYISCDPATMARDIKILSEKGFHTKDVTAVDMFPRTEHVETVVLMSRVDR